MPTTRVSAYRFAWSVTKDDGLARDVVQELFLKLARDADAVTKARSERAVIFMMVRNLWRSMRFDDAHARKKRWSQ
jgi:DNA-directed RNA polymerase specialized sigma24 family protein